MVWLLVTDGLIIWGHFVFGENPSYKLDFLISKIYIYGFYCLNTVGLRIFNGEFEYLKIS